MFDAIVVDGVTLGHKCCSATSAQMAELAKLPPNTKMAPCFEPLARVNDRFCQVHLPLLSRRCQVQPCRKQAMPDSKTCNSPAHIQYMADFKERVEGNSGMVNLLNRPGSRLPVDTSLYLNEDTAEIEDLDGLRESDEADRAFQAVRDGGESQEGKMSCSQNRTHNEQAAVFPCGITAAFQTFFRAESIPAVKVSCLYSSHGYLWG